MNIKQFVGIDSSFKDKNGVPMAHEEIYTKVVNAIGLKRCFSFVPASPEQIQRALETDKHLNNIPLQECGFKNVKRILQHREHFEEKDSIKLFKNIKR